MGPVPEEPVYVDDDHAEIAGFAEKYFDDDEERDAFVDTLMERRGYQRVSSWGPAAPEPDPEPDPRPGRARQPRQQQAPEGRGRPYFKR